MEEFLPAWSIFIEACELTPWSYAALISPIIVAGFATKFKIANLQYLKIPCVHTAVRNNSDHKYAGDGRLQTDDLLCNDIAVADYDIVGSEVDLQTYSIQNSSLSHGGDIVNFQTNNIDYIQDSTSCLAESTPLLNDLKKEGTNASVVSPGKSSLQSTGSSKTTVNSPVTSAVEKNQKTTVDLNPKFSNLSLNKKSNIGRPENPKDKNPKDKIKKKVTFSDKAIEHKDIGINRVESLSFASKAVEKKDLNYKLQSGNVTSAKKEVAAEKTQLPPFTKPSVYQNENELNKLLNTVDANIVINDKGQLNAASAADVKTEIEKLQNETILNKELEMKTMNQLKTATSNLERNVNELRTPSSNSTLKSSSSKLDQIIPAKQNDISGEAKVSLDSTPSQSGNTSIKYNSFNAMESIFSIKKNMLKNEVDYNETNSKRESNKVVSKMKVSTLDSTIPLIPGYKPILTELPIKTILPTAVDLRKTLEKVSHFDSVPGPIILKTIGNMWKYVPILGTQFVASFIYSMQSVISSYDRRLKYPATYPYYYLLNKFGPMVRLHSPLGADILIAAVNGEDLPLIYSKTKGNKTRSLFDSLNTYRKEAVPTDLNLAFGSNIDKSKLQGNPILTMDKYYSSVENITDKLLRKDGKFIMGHSGENQDENHEADLMRWALQCNLDVYFKSVKNILECGSTNSDKLVDSFLKTSKSIRLSETGIQLWRAFTTLTWLDLTENAKYIDSFITDEVSKCVAGLNSGKPNGSVTEALITTEELKTSDILTPLLDLLVINVNTVAYTTGFLLYNISRTPQVQRTLHREISNIVPKGKSIAQADLSKLKYLNACIIETLRLSPPFPYLSRELEEDTMINGYLIPKGTFIQMVNVLPCTRGDYMCDEIGKFQAERWTDKGSNVRGDLLAGLPQWNSFPNFNKDFVVAQIALLAAKIIKDYRMEYPGKELYSDGMVMSGPTSPFTFKFIERQI